MVLNIKGLQTIIAMISENKITEIFRIADDFCKVFDAQIGIIHHKKQLQPQISSWIHPVKGRNNGYRYPFPQFIKNIAQVEYSRHRSFDNFIVNTLGALAAYCFFPKRPTIAVQRTIDRQLTLF